MDPLSILVDQHKSIRSLLEAVKKPGPERTKRIERLHSELDLHMYLEESHLYPALENYDSLKSQVFTFWKEHERIREELQALHSVHQDEHAFRGRRSRLSSFFEEHVREEESHVFPEARKLLGSDQLEKIARDLLAATQGKGVAA